MASVAIGVIEALRRIEKVRWIEKFRVPVEMLPGGDPLACVQDAIAIAIKPLAKFDIGSHARRTGPVSSLPGRLAPNDPCEEAKREGGDEQ